MASIALTILGTSVTADDPALPERASLDRVLPLLYDLDNRAIDLAIAQVERAGQSISCTKGCSACCRAQPVPITPPEALALAKLVDRLPAERQAEVRTRFAHAVARIEQAGQRALLLREEPITSKEQARAVARQYFDLKIACPFLEDDACGIYTDRPFVCRQYLVTSPAHLCNDPFTNPVKPIDVPLRPASAMLDVAERYLGGPQLSVPLTLALEFSARHMQSLQREVPLHEVVSEFAAALG